MKLSSRKGLFLLTIIAILIGLCINEIKTNKKLSNRGMFTVGVLLKKKTSRGCTGNVYKFKVNTTEYKNQKCSKYKGKIGQRYFVVFNPNNIKENRILLNYPVPDSIVYAPSEGWNHLPITFDKDKLEKSIR